MDEFILQDIERLLSTAPPTYAAAVAFAAVLRLGELGKEGVQAFARHEELASTEPELTRTFQIGLRALV